MATIYMTNTSKTAEIDLRDESGQDFMDDVLGGFGFERLEGGWAMDSDEAEWWATWAGREEILGAAYNDANDAQRREYERATILHETDLEAMQDAQARALGIGSF